MLQILVGLGVLNLAGLLYVLLRPAKLGVDGYLRDEFAQNRKEFTEANKELRMEISARVEQLRDKNDEKLEQIRKTVEGRLESLQKDNAETQVMLTADSRDVVDFAIKLPDKSSSHGYIYLPIDAKFPLEDYQRLVAAQEKGEIEQVELASKALMNRIKTEAKSIKEKYILPPATTDFAVLYVPTEGLYAEVL